MATRLNYKGIKYLDSLKNSKKPGINNLFKILSYLNNPQNLLKNKVIISGTNGKGTVAQILNRIYIDGGYKVGLYTSPHLLNINERIKINDKKITFPNLNKYINIIIKATKRIKVNLSYFELLTAVSILYFSKAKNDINIFEVGLGGRFDATNVIKSKIGIITNVEMDHMEYLGDTIEKITYEKIGIINNESTLITSVRPRSIRTIRKYCKENDTKIFRLNNDFHVESKNNQNQYISGKNKINFKTKLEGAHQLNNISVALKTTEVIKDLYKLNVNKNQIIKSVKNVGNPGRYEVISDNPILIIDVSHNVHSIQTLIKNFQLKNPDKKVNILLGMLKEKNPIKCINLLLKIAKKIYLTEVPNPRTFDPNKVLELLKNKRISYISNDEIPALLNKKDDFILTGSIYLIGSLIKKKYVRLKK